MDRSKKNPLLALAALLFAMTLVVLGFANVAGAAAAPGDASGSGSGTVGPYPTDTSNPTGGSASVPGGGGQAGGSVSGNFAPGGTVTISGGGATPNGGVTASLSVSGDFNSFVARKAETRNIGSDTANGAGAWSITATLPDYSGTATIVVTDNTTGATLFSQSSSAAGGSNNGGGNNAGGNNAGGAANGGSNEGTTAYTGVAAFGIGALGVFLLAGGAAMVFAGRKRRAHA